MTVTVPLAKINITGAVEVRDVWGKADLKDATGTFTTQVCAKAHRSFVCHFWVCFNQAPGSYRSGTFLSWPSCRSMHPVLKTSFCGQVGHHACSFVVFVPKGKHASNLALLVICEFVLTQIACDYRKCVAGAV